MHRKDVQSSQGGQLALTRGEGCGVPGPLPMQACGVLPSPQALAPSSPTWGGGGDRPHCSGPRGGCGGLMAWWRCPRMAGRGGRACSPRRTASARPFRVRRGGRNRVRSRFPSGTGKVPEAPQRHPLYLLGCHVDRIWGPLGGPSPGDHHGAPQGQKPCLRGPTV